MGKIDHLMPLELSPSCGVVKEVMLPVRDKGHLDIRLVQGDLLVAHSPCDHKEQVPQDSRLLAQEFWERTRALPVQKNG